MNKNKFILILLIISTFAKAEWEYIKNEDRMDDSFFYTAISPMTNSLDNEITSNILYQCDTSTEDFMSKDTLIFTFSYINVSLSSRVYGFKDYDLRARFDKNKPIEIRFSEGGDGNYLIVLFSSRDKIVEWITTHKSLLLEIPYHKEKIRYFEYDLTGSAQVINRIKKECGK